MKIARMVRSVALAAIALAVSLPPALAQGSGGQTTLKIYNASNATVAVYLTLNNYGGSNPGFVQNVSTIPFKPNFGMNAVNQFQGYINLPAGKMTTYTPPVGTAIAGNLCFGGGPNNCPTPGVNPNGQNLAEFTLDNNTPAYSPAFTQEAVDISCVNGVNAKLQFDLKAAAGSGPWQTQGFANVLTIANQPFGALPSSNINIPGVYPVGCDTCVADVNPGCDPQWAGWTGSATNLCNVQRAANRSGGDVQITFKGFYPASQQQQSLKPH